MGYANSGLGSAILLRERDDDGTEFSGADMAYCMICTVAIFILTPGIGLFYGGALKKKNIVQILFQTYAVTALITVQWFLFGYSLAVSPSASSVLGNFAFGALQRVTDTGFTTTLPSIMYFTFSAFFPIATVQLFVGAICERGRLLPSLVVGFIWCTVCYCPFAYSTWCANGWLYKLGALDFAGGGPVHIAAGCASLSYSYYLGNRKEWKDPKTKEDYKPSSVISFFIGVSIIWFSWLCFNSGTLCAVNVRTGYIMANTQLAASAASIAFAVIDFALTGKWSLIAACEGAVAGLVNITPSCGFYSPYWAFITSAFVGACCRLLYPFNEWVGIDDTTHSFVIHGIGGILGSICLGVFASAEYAGMDGVTEIPGGWIDHHWKQMGYQFAGWVSITVWSTVGTWLICYVVDHIPGLKLRATEEEELAGMDITEMAETLCDLDELLYGDVEDGRHSHDMNMSSSNGNIEVIEGKSTTSQVYTTNVTHKGDQSV